MKKGKNTPVRIHITPVPSPDGSVPFAGWFCLFFFCGLGFFLSCKEIHGSSASLFLCIVAILILSLYFTLWTAALGLDRTRRNRSLAVLLAGIFCVLFFLRKTLMTQGSSFFGYLHARVQYLYKISLFEGSSSSSEDCSVFFLFCTLLYLFFLLFCVYKKKKGLFSCLLLLPVLLLFLLEVRPSLLSIGCLLIGFFSWDFLLLGRFRPVFIQTAFLLGVYCFCAVVLTPLFSKTAFQKTQELYNTVQYMGTRLEIFFDRISASMEEVSPGKQEEVSTPPSVSQQTPDATGQIQDSAPSGSSSSPVQQTEREFISTSTPIYNNQTMFTFHTNRLFDTPVYLRGFTGHQYENNTWETLSQRQWDSFCDSYALSEEMQDSLPSLPFKAGKTADSLSLAKIRIKPAFSPLFTYLPYGADVPAGMTAGDGNALSRRTSSAMTCACYPLSLDSAYVLESPGLSALQKSAEKAYGEFVQKTYTYYEKALTDQLMEEVKTLPVYSSFPKNPGYQDIRAAAEEIKSFLSSHAVYSLELSSVPQGENLLEHFLYEEKKGFCVHFATAGTLLFRMYGIPARYVSGYIIAPDSLQEDAKGSYFCDVPDSSAHAWTEVYIGKGGWVPVEMTPAAPDNPASAPPSVQKEKDQTPTETPKDSNTEKRAFLSIMTKILSFFLLFLLFSALLFSLFCFRRVFLCKKRMGAFCTSKDEAFFCVFNSILDLWSAAFHLPALNPQSGDFPLLFKETLPDENRELFDRLYAQAENFCFGKDTPGKQDIRSLRHVYMQERRKFFSSCPKKQKLYYLFLRVF